MIKKKIPAPIDQSRNARRVAPSLLRHAVLPSAAAVLGLLAACRGATSSPSAIRADQEIENHREITPDRLPALVPPETPASSDSNPIALIVPPPPTHVGWFHPPAPVTVACAGSCVAVTPVYAPPTKIVPSPGP